MESLPKQHFLETKRLIYSVDKKDIADWMLKNGYFPEQYVLPPCFHVEKFQLKVKEFYSINKKSHPEISEILKISFPKSHLVDITFGLIPPKIYHDLVFHLINEWQFVLDHIFNSKTSIYSYSFPIPVSKEDVGNLGILRSGRMIYEFLEMAENDLVAEAYQYRYLVRTDISNFYPSIYTHSIAWALHGKIKAREDRWKYKLLGTKIDKLFQNSNDGCTNGLPIGPVVSDLISEIILSTIDKECSIELKSQKIEFLGVRFKDDYRILCNSKDDAACILKIIQEKMNIYNLKINESKSTISELPEGLYRPAFSEYQQFSLKKKEEINYKEFETTIIRVMNIDQEYPGTGLIDKFLSELISEDFILKLELMPSEVSKVFSLLLLLKERRSKSFPQILACIELMIDKYLANVEIVDEIIKKIINLSNRCNNLYDKIWLDYFLKTLCKASLLNKELNKSPLLKSVKTNKQKFFTDEKDIVLFRKIDPLQNNIKLAEHLAIFNKNANQ